jgi:hypothetical protein
MKGLLRVGWRRVRRLDPDRRYVLEANLLVVDRWRAVPKVFRSTLTVIRELRRSGGLIGVVFVARPLRKTFYALSAWEDRAALDGFVASARHGRTMAAIRPHLVVPGSAFVTWESYGSELPPRPGDVTARLEAAVVRMGAAREEANPGRLDGPDLGGLGAADPARADARPARPNGSLPH